MAVATPKIIVITGASDGIGAAAARALNASGHHVVIVGRSERKTEAIARELGVNYYLADFAQLDDVRQLAADLTNTYERIDVLANNAGGIFGDPAKTIDGFEKTFQINHLAPFLLTSSLLPILIASRASVIQTSSVGARSGKVVIDDLDHDRDFTPVRAYGAAKLENILFTTELDRRYRAQGLASAAFHPGNVASNFAKESDSWLKYLAKAIRPFLITPEKAAAQLIWLATTTAGSEWTSGTYYEKFKPARRVNPQAKDATLAQELWDRSEALLGIHQQP